MFGWVIFVGVIAGLLLIPFHGLFTEPLMQSSRPRLRKAGLGLAISFGLISVAIVVAWVVWFVVWTPDPCAGSDRSQCLRDLNADGPNSVR
jgi:hypothetical protein